MKKICMITTVSITMQSFVVETAKHLHETCGYDVTLICNEDADFAASLPPDIRFIPVPMARGVDLSALRSIRCFYRIFKREKFDMVQYATPNASCYASIAARWCKVPIRLYCQWGIRYVGFGGLKRTLFKALEKLVCRNSTHVRAVSPQNRAFAVAEGLYPPEKAAVVGNGGTIGVDMTTYDMVQKEIWRQTVRTQYGLQENDLVFGFAGRVSADKGCAELLAAFRALSKSEPRARLLIVGPMEENCGVPQELLAWAKASERVVLTGKIDNRDMRLYYAAMDVLCHPTYREGFGMVIQEAGALGVPVITTAIPGASEVMEDGVSCVLVPPKDADGLQAAMEKLAADEERIAALGQAAYARTRERYERTVMLANQREDYRTLLEG
ncbi:MAG: glycosyltransferase family 4 protein [Clostridia bacterium]|nr:glycosyltransferase family 4 protein [Clostridia bacterium]